MNDIAAYVFDLFGTLVDYSSLRDRFVTRVADPDAFIATWRAKQVTYSFAATLMDRYVDFDTLTARAFAFTAALVDLQIDDRACAEAVTAWSQLPAYEDAAPVLRDLYERGHKLAVLSNGTPKQLATTLDAIGLAPYLDGALSVAGAAAFKPHPSAYALATTFFATSPERIVFVSSNGWDATGAAEFGLRVVWCNRSGAPAETFGRVPERTISSLAELLAFPNSADA